MSTFADPAIQQILADHFVAVAQDTDYTERRGAQDALKGFFSEIVEQRDRKKFEGASPSPMQGYYAFDHTGKLFDAMAFNIVSKRRLPDESAFDIRRRDVSLLVEMLRETIERYKEEPPAVGDYDPKGERTPTYPEVPDDVRILRSWTRIRPLEGKKHQLNTLLGRDTLWVRMSELAEMAEGRMPEVFARRLALGNLRDNIRGAPRTFTPEHIETLGLLAEVIHRDERQLHVRIRGEFRISAPAANRVRPLPAMGYEGAIEGVLQLSRPELEPVSWWMYADGQAWGDYPNTPNAPPGKYPLKVGFVLAAGDDSLARRLPPLAATGDPRRYLERGIATRVAGISDD